MRQLHLTLTQHLPQRSGMMLVLLLIVVSGSTGQRRRSRQSPPTRPNTAPGPNMCKVQHVLGTREKFFTHCISSHLKMICERPTYERWECCSGFQKRGREPGCPVEKPLGNIMQTARDLRMDQFVNYADKVGISEDLTNHGPYTVFVPTNEAFLDVSRTTTNHLNPSDGSLSLLNYHIAPGRLNISTFLKNNQELVTLYDGSKVRVNKYAYGVATVNCARIVRPDEMATNGIVHVIDKVINPLDVAGTLASKIEKDARFSQFNMALLASDMLKKLQSSQASYTVLAPTNHAFSKLPSRIMDSILTDDYTAEKLIKRHIVRGVYCADAIVVAVGLKTVDDSRLLFRCKRDGMHINEAKVIHPDLVTSNGVIHGIDTVLLPDSVKSVTELLEDMRLDRFLEQMKKVNLTDMVHQENITIFPFTNDAYKYYSSVFHNKPLDLDVIRRHIVNRTIGEGELIGESDLATFANMTVKLKVKVTRLGVTLDKANVDDHPRQCKNAMIHKVDKVLVAPENSLMDQIKESHDLSMFADMLQKSGVSEELLPQGSYTVVAPTNYALYNIDSRQLDAIKKNIHRLRRFVNRHVIDRMVMKCDVPYNGLYALLSRQKDITDFYYDTRKQLHVGKLSRAVSEDIMTSNGILYKIDHVVPCSCERDMRTHRGQYIHGHRYRRRYR